MRVQSSWIIWVLITICFGVATAQDKAQAPMPTEIYLGRYSWVDVGPPFSYYEVISLRSVADGVQIERIKVTPPSDACYTSSSVSSSSADVKEPIAQLLADMNPCSIPEEEITRGQEQCKDCVDLSGRTVLMQTSCAGQTRRIHMQDTLDKYVFDPHRETPESTSWTGDFMNRMNRALAGYDIVDKPVLQNSPPSATLPPIRAAEFLGGIEAGDFDSLFPRGNKVSAIALRAKTNPIPPVSIVGNLAPAPSNLTLPYYPRIARAAHVGGTVKAVFTVSPEGTVSELKITDGQPMLRGSVESAMKLWKFDKEASGKVVEVQFKFNLDCAGLSHP